MTPSSHLRDTIRAAREERGWSQDELAHHSGVSRPTIARLEAGRSVSTENLTKLATALGFELKLEPSRKQE